jgi:uncharacterized protein
MSRTDKSSIGKRWIHYQARALRTAAIAAVVGAFLLLGTAFVPARADTPNGITVGGSGSAQLPPDLARVSGNVETQGATASDALNQNSQTMQAVLAAVRAFGASDQDIQTNRVSIFPIFSSSSGATANQPATPPSIVGYRATNGLTVKVRDLTTVGDLIQTMVNAGVNDFTGVDYALQNPEQLRQMALNAAIADAQAEAQTAAAALGVRLGGVLNMTTQSTSAPPVPFAARAVAAPAPPGVPPPPVLPGPQSATTNVTVTFAILGP